jgi:hypothetical protein
MRKALAITALVAALTIPGAPVLADDGASSVCPIAQTGAEFGEHLSHMANAGQMGADMNPGMHRGFSPMAR